MSDGMFSSHFEMIMGRAEQAMGGEVREEVLPEAKRLCPVKTGALRDSLVEGVERDGTVITAFIETPSPYAAFQEFGSHDRAGKAFMRKGLEKFGLARVAARMQGQGGDS